MDTANDAIKPGAKVGGLVGWLAAPLMRIRLGWAGGAHVCRRRSCRRVHPLRLHCPAPPHPAPCPQVLLTYKGQDVGVLDVESRWQPNKASRRLAWPVMAGTACRKPPTVNRCLRSAARLASFVGDLQRAGALRCLDLRASFTGCRWLRRSSATAPLRWSTPQVRLGCEPAVGGGAHRAAAVRTWVSCFEQEAAALSPHPIPPSAHTLPSCPPLPHSVHDCHRARPLLPGRQGHRLRAAQAVRRQRRGRGQLLPRAPPLGLAWAHTNQLPSAL